MDRRQLLALLPATLIPTLPVAAAPKRETLREYILRAADRTALPPKGKWYNEALKTWQESPGGCRYCLIVNYTDKHTGGVVWSRCTWLDSGLTEKVWNEHKVPLQSDLTRWINTDQGPMRIDPQTFELHPFSPPAVRPPC